ncbi:MAG: hypothetical protein M0R46_09885 [Candidatus Muirbacterium halophilum]|nr:hypothetical protein [Candidatus Muirbacterium halophilum]
MTIEGIISKTVEYQNEWEQISKNIELDTPVFNKKNIDCILEYCDEFYDTNKDDIQADIIDKEYSSNEPNEGEQFTNDIIELQEAKDTNEELVVTKEKEHQKEFIQVDTDMYKEIIDDYLSKKIDSFDETKISNIYLMNKIKTLSNYNKTLENNFNNLLEKVKEVDKIKNKIEDLYRKLESESDLVSLSSIDYNQLLHEVTSMNNNTNVKKTNTAKPKQNNTMTKVSKLYKENKNFIYIAGVILSLIVFTFIFKNNPDAEKINVGKIEKNKTIMTKKEFTVFCSKSKFEQKYNKKTTLDGDIDNASKVFYFDTTINNKKERCFIDIEDIAKIVK